MNIVSDGHDGQYILMHKGQPVQVGQVFHTERGSYIVLSGNAPHTDASTGRVNVRDAIPRPGSISDRSFFPSVVDCKWEKVK